MHAKFQRDRTTPSQKKWGGGGGGVFQFWDALFFAQHKNLVNFALGAVDFNLLANSNNFVVDVTQ